MVKSKEEQKNNKVSDDLFRKIRESKNRNKRKAKELRKKKKDIVEKKILLGYISTSGKRKTREVIVKKENLNKYEKASSDQAFSVYVCQKIRTWINFLNFD